MLSALLLAVVCTQLLMPVAPDFPPAGRLPRRHSQTAAPLPSDFPEILRRPIFTQDRQPAMEPMEGIVLLGTGSAGEQFMALLKTGDEVVRTHVGDRVMGWRIAGLERDRVFFERGEERRILLLDFQSRRAAITPPAVPRSQ